jgi:putative Mg2+ transporter-C (MgtC) family protein
VPDVADIPGLGWDGALLRLVVAAALGGAVGLERELDAKAAGLRTHMLVAVGSALFTLVSAYGFHEFLTTGGNVVQADPSRIAAQIVTGIGFLGAGVIFRHGPTVQGLTTAASLWLVAAVGMAAGAGFWSGAVIAAAVALVSLRPLEWAKERLLPKPARRHLLHVELREDASGAQVLEHLERLGAVRSLRREGAHLEADVEVERGDRARVLATIAELPEVAEARWS